MAAAPGSVTDKLAANFAAQPMRVLEFSTKARVHGDPSGDAWESLDSGDEDVDLAELRDVVTRRDGNHCTYCHARTSTLQLDATNDNHNDLTPDNNVAACPLCHGYHHLGELGDGAAAGRVAFLPGLDSSDVNLLQRMLTAELYGQDEEARNDARDLVNWLASHSVYVAEVFGSDDPTVFASALRRVEPSWKARRAVVFENLALVYNPRTMHEHAHVWAQELAVAVPQSSRSRLFQDVMNLHE